ncbi:MAG TPA: EamA family transporter [Marinobacter sp.]|nr:EamA family transporter [Marinobacter sp.]
MNPHILAAVLAAIFMGTIGPISIYTDASAETVTFYRLFIGAVLMGGFFLITGQKDKMFIWPGMRVLVTGALLAGFVVFYILAMNHTSMANAVMLLYLAPVTASVIAHLFMGERLSVASGGLIGVALFGFAMIMEFNFNLTGREDEALGLFYALCAMLCYAAFILINRLIHERVHVLTRSGYQMLVGAVCVLPFMLLKGDTLVGAQWGWLIAAGVIPGFLGIILTVVALRALPAATFGTLAYLEPITVVLLGWVLFAQSLNTLQIAGSVLIIISGVIQAVLSQRASRWVATGLETEAG